MHLTAVSSFRALADNGEVCFNQLKAIESWRPVFSQIVLFGAKEPRLASPQTEFVDAGDFPKIQTLALAASLADDMACIINSDIVVGANLTSVIQEVTNKGGTCATSRRYEFDATTGDLPKARVVDNGIDFFCAYPDLWQKVVREVPRQFRLGHAAWDSWMMGFFNTNQPKQFWDITSRAVIYHPYHFSRKRKYEIMPHQDKYTGQTGFPKLKL